jgi:hypothetical protein
VEVICYSNSVLIIAITALVVGAGSLLSLRCAVADMGIWQMNVKPKDEENAGCGYTTKSMGIYFNEVNVLCVTFAQVTVFTGIRHLAVISIAFLVDGGMFPVSDGFGGCCVASIEIDVQWSGMSGLYVK